MTRKKKKSVPMYSKAKQSSHRKTKSKSKTFSSLRQLGYKKAFRIPPPMLCEELLDAIETDSSAEVKITTKPAKKIETKDLLLLIADLATGLWRIDKKTAVNKTDQMQDSMRSVRRHVESTLDALSSAKVEIRDHTGEKYVTGMALKVIAFQPTSSVQVEKIAETVKPSVFYKNQLIQRGVVIVDTPEAEVQGQKSKANGIGEVESTDENKKNNRAENT